MDALRRLFNKKSVPGVTLVEPIKEAVKKVEPVWVEQSRYADGNVKVERAKLGVETEERVTVKIPNSEKGLVFNSNIDGSGVCRPTSIVVMSLDKPSSVLKIENVNSDHSNYSLKGDDFSVNTVVLNEYGPKFGLSFAKNFYRGDKNLESAADGFGHPEVWNWIKSKLE